METNALVQKKKTDPLQLARLKAASEDYKHHKAIYIDPVTDEQLEGFIEWPMFRDAFLIDWKSNRRVVTEKEADVHFDTLANESLSELENIGTPTDVAALAEQVAPEDSDESDTIGVIVANPKTGEPIAVATTIEKRRGRPAGKKVVVDGALAKEFLAKAKTKTVKAAKPVAHKVAAKKKGVDKGSKAQSIVERYLARKWARKDVIEKLESQLGITAANAGYYFQKFK